MDTVDLFGGARSSILDGQDADVVTGGDQRFGFLQNPGIVREAVQNKHANARRSIPECTAILVRLWPSLHFHFGRNADPGLQNCPASQPLDAQIERMTTMATIVGARPQFIKAAVVSRRGRTLDDMREFLIHTGQHYDDIGQKGSTLRPPTPARRPPARRP